MYYASRQMSPAERKYTTTEQEAFAVVYACKKFRHYLLGYRIIFHTDHDSLKYLLNKPDLSGRIARWILLLQEFNYEVMVKSGKSNSNADYLSRQRGEEAVGDIQAEFPDEFLDDLNWKEEMVFHLNGEEPSEFDNIISYITNRIYPPGLNREEKSVPTQGCTLQFDQGNPIQDGSRRAIAQMPGEEGSQNSDESFTFRALGWPFCSNHNCQPDPIGRILVAIPNPGRKELCRKL